MKRTAYREVPPRVEYELTEDGKELINLLADVKVISAKLDEEEHRRWGNPPM